MRIQVKAGLAFFCMLAVSAAADSRNWVELFSTDWSHGVDKRIQYQMPRKDSIGVVDAPQEMGGKALKVTISKNDDYSAVANGAPRAELSFNGFLHFSQGKEYVLSWQTYMPAGYTLDRGQAEVVFQIHQGPAAGYPPFAIFLSEGGQYEVHNRTQSKADWVSAFFGRVESDRGRVVNWQLHYIPDGSGARAVTELTKDGQLVFATKGVPNAYEDDDRAYLKLGLYKADWLKKSSEVDTRTMYYGGVSVKVRD
ncbi:heparin lyase I family protein [Dyella amyloliquefaciens]|uniref:heparin lyase I family protein n=1 Tax=Dyella amyloliquefaciens TaxID=1770545 RepID=UPI0013EECF36|nr:heparin lyase I family protein [Dyella amyloliquefaciens]